MVPESPGRPRTVIGPAGQPLSIKDLPSPQTKRWVIRRKAEVVAAVKSNLISLEDACERYKLSVEEFLSWQRLIEKHGMRGLRTTRLQQYRRTTERYDPTLGSEIPTPNTLDLPIDTVTSK